MKEFVIIIVILIIIFGGAFYSKKYLEQTSKELIKELKELKTHIKKSKETENREEITKLMKKVYHNWQKTENGWAIIVLHDELDLIETSFVKMKSSIEDGELEESLEELETAIFLVNHINKKEEFCIKNIF